MAATETFTRERMKPLLEPFGLVEAVKAGGLIHLAGQTGIDASHQIVSGGLKAQALQAFRNREEVLAGVRAGSTAVRVKALLTPEILIEIQAVAAL